MPKEIPFFNGRQGLAHNGFKLLQSFSIFLRISSIDRFRSDDFYRTVKLHAIAVVVVIAMIFDFIFAKLLDPSNRNTCSGLACSQDLAAVFGSCSVENKSSFSRIVICRQLCSDVFRSVAVRSRDCVHISTATDFLSVERAGTGIKEISCHICQKFFAFGCLG